MANSFYAHRSERSERDPAQRPTVAERGGPACAPPGPDPAGYHLVVPAGGKVPEPLEQGPVELRVAALDDQVDLLRAGPGEVPDRPLEPLTSRREGLFIVQRREIDI